MAPEIPAPSILDYRPKSTLVTPEHMVKTAKFPPSTTTATRGLLTHARTRSTRVGADWTASTSA